jgi:hypothetical protein
MRHLETSLRVLPQLEMEKALFRQDNGANTLRSKGSTKGHVDHYNHLRVNSAIGYIMPEDMLVRHQ